MANNRSMKETEINGEGAARSMVGPVVIQPLLVILHDMCKPVNMMTTERCYRSIPVDVNGMLFKG